MNAEDMPNRNIGPNVNRNLHEYLGGMVTNIRMLAGMVKSFAAIRVLSDEWKAQNDARQADLKNRWERLSTDLVKVTGIHLLPYDELVSTGGTFYVEGKVWDVAPHTTTLRELKALADSARLSDPTITLLGGPGPNGFGVPQEVE